MYMSCRICCSMVPPGCTHQKGRQENPDRLLFTQLLTPRPLQEPLLCAASFVTLPQLPASDKLISSAQDSNRVGSRKPRGSCNPTRGSRNQEQSSPSVGSPSTASQQHLYLGFPWGSGTMQRVKASSSAGQCPGTALPGPQVSSDLLVEGNNDTSCINDTAPASQEPISPLQVRGGGGGSFAY